MTQGGRDAVLEMLEEACEEAHRKAVSGRVYDEDAEQVRQGWFRTLAYCAGQYRQLSRDEDLDEMSEAIETLQTVTAGASAYSGSLDGDD